MGLRPGPDRDHQTVEPPEGSSFTRRTSRPGTEKSPVALYLKDESKPVGGLSGVCQGSRIG